MSELNIENLTKRYGKFCAVDNFSIKVGDGELLAVLGPSGCGKSTLLACIAGIEELSRGKIILDGRCVYNSEDGSCIPPENRNIGFVFQNYALWPHMTVEANLAFPLKVRKKSRPFIRSEVNRILKMIRLEEKEKRFPGELSGGEQQRVALGRALIMQPELLLLDEPLSNLDARLRDEMQTEIRAIQQELGITAIHVTHDQSEALAMSDRIVVMNSGKLVQAGTPSEIYNNPGTFFTADFMGTNNIIEGVINNHNGASVFDNGKGLIFTRQKGDEVLDGRVYCIIRPEDISICSNDEQTQGESVRAVIETRTYKGAHFIYRVKTSGEKLRIQAHSSEFYDIGSAVSLDLRRCAYLPR